MTKRFQRLWTGNICGIITSQGEIRSEFTGEKLENHYDLFGHQPFRWRWQRRRELHWFTVSARPNMEQQEEILRHLAKKYSIPFLENGATDDEKLKTLIEKEEQHDQPATNTPEQRPADVPPPALQLERDPEGDPSRSLRS